MVVIWMQTYVIINVENGETWASKNSGSGRDKEAKNLEFHEQYKIKRNQTVEVAKQQAQRAIKQQEENAGSSKIIKGQIYGGEEEWRPWDQANNKP